MNHKETILLLAYKNFVLKNVENGFLGQHIQETDFYAFNEYPEFFLEVLEKAQEKGFNDCLVENFFKYNPKQTKNKDLAKSIFLTLKRESDFDDLFTHFPSKQFLNDTKLVLAAIKKTKGQCFSFRSFSDIRRNSELRRILIERNQEFNPDLTLFDLPDLNYFNEDVHEIITNRPQNYNILADEYKTKELTIETINAYSKAKFYDSKTRLNLLYKAIPEQLKEDLDISIALAKTGFQLPEDKLSNPLIFKAWIESFSLKAFDEVSNIIQTNPSTVENIQNVLCFYEWLNYHCEKIQNYKDYSNLNYPSFYKCIKTIISNNKTVKDYVKKNEETHNLHLGSTSLNKNLTARSILQFLDDTTPSLVKLFKKEALSKDIQKNPNAVSSKPKI